jgi:hypothetical protein
MWCMDWRTALESLNKLAVARICVLPVIRNNGLLRNLIMERAFTYLNRSTIPELGCSNWRGCLVNLFVGLSFSLGSIRTKFLRSMSKRVVKWRTVWQDFFFHPKPVRTWRSPRGQPPAQLNEWKTNNHTSRKVVKSCVVWFENLVKRCRSILVVGGVRVIWWYKLIWWEIYT